MVRGAPGLSDSPLPRGDTTSAVADQEDVQEVI